MTSRVAAGTVDTLLTIEDLELAFGGTPEDKRAFGTLVVKGGTQARGGLGAIFRAMTMDGRVVAVKRMLPPDRFQFSSQESWQKEFDNRASAFREEYATLCRLSAFKGFVKVFGYGNANGAPAILMEWVVGVPLSKLINLPAFTSQRGVARTLTVARIGRDLFRLLARLESQAELFVHRDISPANVMIRLANRPIDQQIVDGTFDLCFIDFGSAASMSDGDGTFTTATRILRGATPDFAAPEMLSNDLPGLAELRRSTKIDVYAACGVIYWLLCGRPPFTMDQRTGAAASSDYLYKMTHDPEPCGFPPGSVEELLEHILLLGIRPTQDARASAYALYKSLDFYVANYNDNLRRAASGSSLSGLDIRSIDLPNFEDEQIDLSNPLAEATMARKSQSWPPSVYSTPGPVGPSPAPLQWSQGPSVDQGDGDASSGAAWARIAIIVAAVVIALVAGFAIVRAMTPSQAGPGDEEAGQSSEADDTSSAEPVDSGSGLQRTWTGEFSSTTNNFACFGAQNNPCTISIHDMEEDGDVVVSGSVLFHGHNRNDLSDNVKESDGDELVQLGDLKGAVDGNSIDVVDDDEDKLGADSSMRIVIEWEGSTSSPESVTAKVYSSYEDSEICDSYSLS